MLAPRTVAPAMTPKATAENPNPMGAFELVVELDSDDTAIEVRDREVEFFDHVQRVFEDETFRDLETVLGKDRLKSRIKRELNHKLTQGWVKDVKFKTFVCHAGVFASVVLIVPAGAALTTVALMSRPDVRACFAER